jgi:hypothetical protein
MMLFEKCSPVRRPAERRGDMERLRSHTFDRHRPDRADGGGQQKAGAIISHRL